MAAALRHSFVAEVVGLAAGVCAWLAGLSLWWILGSSVGAAALLLLRIRRRSVLDWVCTTARFASKVRRDTGLAIDVWGTPGQPGSDSPVGVIWRNTTAVVVVEVLPPGVGVTLLERDRSSCNAALPLAAITECLTQRDITLSGIDIISLGERAASGSPATDVYEKLIGPLPATANRSVRLAVAFDVTRNRDAVAHRGGGRAGAHRAIIIAATRIVRALRESHLDSKILSAAEIEAASSFMSRGVSGHDLTQNWTHTSLPGVWDVGYGIEPKFLTEKLFAQLWSVPSVATTVAIKIRPTSISGTASIGASCRVTTRAKPRRVRIKGLISMNGRQRDSFLAAMPFMIGPLDTIAPTMTTKADSPDVLEIPAMGCGQLIGSDTQGLGVAAVLFGRGLRSVYIASELYLAQQIIFRAVAIGARVIVRSDRPHAWTTLIDSIATPGRLNLEGRTIPAGAHFNVLLVDRFAASSLPDEQGSTTARGLTTIFLTDHTERWPAARPDLSIVQPGACGDRIRIQSALIDTELVLVTTSLETAFIGRPRNLRASPVPSVR